MFEASVVMFDVIAAQKRHGKEAVGTTQGYFTSEKDLVCAANNSQSHATGDFNDGHNIAQPLPCDESIGKRSFMFIVATNKESNVG